jgi:hypothetical protein
MSDTADVFAEALQGLGAEYGFETTEEVAEVTEADSEDQEVEELEAEAEGDEAEESEEVAEEDEPAEAGVVEISEDMEFVLPDGSTVSGKDILFRQADYTRKTQALAEERKELEAKFEELSGSTEYVEKLASAWEENPVGVIAGFLEDVDDPTTALAQTIVQLARNGALDPKFLETFGITPDVQEKWAVEAKRESEVAELRRRLDEQERDRLERTQSAETERELQDAVAEFERQWDSVVSRNGLDPQDFATKVAVLEFARDSEITNLEKAYAAWRYEQLQSEKAKRPTSDKKRATSAVTKKSSPKTSVSDPKPGNIEDAAWAAFNELTAGKG